MNQSDPTAPSAPPVADDPPGDAPTEITQPLPAGTANIGDVDIVTLPLPPGASTEATLALIKAKTDNLDVALSTRTKPTDTQPVSAAALPLPAGASTEATLATRATEATLATRLALADVSIKAAATAAVAADKSLVVAQSPNSPTPPGANHIGGVLIDAALPAGTNYIGKVKGEPDPLTGPAPAVAVVGVASAAAVAANGGRRGLVLTNLSAVNISLGFGANAAVLGSGITLLPNAVWSMDFLTLSREAINAIAGAAASNLGVQEFV